MKSRFRHHTRLIFLTLKNQTRAERRAMFEAVQGFLDRETDGQFESLHDFLVSTPEQISDERGEEILSRIRQAIRDRSWEDLAA